MAKSAKWKNAEPYMINPSNSRGLNWSGVLSVFGSGISKWESEAGDIRGIREIYI